MHVVAVGGPIDAGTERGEKKRGERTWMDAGEERRGGGGREMCLYHATNTNTVTL